MAYLVIHLHGTRELKQTGATFIRNCWVVGNKSEWMDNNRRFCLHMQSPSAVFRFFSDLPQHTPEMLVHGESSAKRPKTSGLGMILTKVGWSLYGVTSFENSWLIILFWCFVLPSIPNIYVYIHMNMCVCCATQSINQSINQSSKQASEQSINQSISQSFNQSINQSIYIYIYTYIHRYTYVYIYNYIHIPGITGNYHDKWWTGTARDFSVAKKRRTFNQHRAGAGCWWTPLMKTGAWRTKWIWVKMEGLWLMEPQMLYIYI